MGQEKTNQYGATYKFGVKDADAPTIEGMKVRTAQIKYEPQVNEIAVDGEGHGESITVSKPEERKATATFSGYVTDADALATAADFAWNDRFWIITNAGDNADKGKYADASIEAYSLPGVEAATQSGGSGS